jgi:hypothetical protein
VGGRGWGAGVVEVGAVGVRASREMAGAGVERWGEWGETVEVGGVGGLGARGAVVGAGVETVEVG